MNIKKIIAREWIIALGIPFISWYLMSQAITLKNNTELLYFFSALAQCAAAFVALIGVFAVFRLQANSAVVINRYREASEWLRTAAHEQNYGSIDVINSQVFLDIKFALQRTSKHVDEKLQVKAQIHLDQITEAEKFPEALPNMISKPLTFWAGIFLISIMIIPVTNLFLGTDGVRICLAVSLLVLLVLIETKRVIQKCLDAK